MLTASRLCLRSGGIMTFVILKAGVLWQFRAMIKIGIVLSGGGARSIAHLGVLQALEDLGIRPGAIAGASAGAVLGALYAAGHTPRKILDAVQQSVATGLLNKISPGFGLFTISGLTRFFNDTKLHRNFEDLAIPLWVSATNLRSSAPVIFSSGPLHRALIGSCAVPGITMPVNFRHMYLADGGLLDNLPAHAIRPHCQMLIGSNVNGFQTPPSPKASRLDLMDKCFHLVIAGQVAASAALCDYCVMPDLHQFSMFELKHPGQLFRAGYRAIIAQEKLLRDLMKIHAIAH